MIVCTLAASHIVRSKSQPLQLVTVMPHRCGAVRYVRQSRSTCQHVERAMQYVMNISHSLVHVMGYVQLPHRAFTD